MRKDYKNPLTEVKDFTLFHGHYPIIKELNKIRKHPQNQFGILISDGNYNRGENPLELAKKFPKLHVIGIPADNDADRGIDTCREIAKAGNGKFYAVEDYKEIPRALIELLSQN